MSTSGSASAAASTGGSFGGVNSGFGSSSILVQRYDAPVDILVNYALSAPIGPWTEPTTASSSATIGHPAPFGMHFAEGSGWVLLEGYTEFHLTLYSGGLIQLSVDPNPDTETPPFDSAYIAASGAISWAVAAVNVTPILPGQTPLTPIQPDAAVCRYQDCPVEIEPRDRITGIDLTFPAVGPIGHTGSAFVGVPTQVVGGPSTGALVTGYEVTSEYSPLTSFVVPDLPPSAEGLTIDTGAGPQSVVAGEMINFGTEGLESFTLAGFDPMLASAELDAFVMGLQFAEEGLASLSAIPTVFIPPGDFNENGVGDAADYTIWRDTAPGMPEGYDLWRSNFGPPSISGGAGQAVPEPATAALAMILLIAGVAFRRSCR